MGLSSCSHAFQLSILVFATTAGVLLAKFAATLVQVGAIAFLPQKQQQQPQQRPPPRPSPAYLVPDALMTMTMGFPRVLVSWMS
jgi:hypothetical protein